MVVAPRQSHGRRHRAVSGVRRPSGFDGADGAVCRRAGRPNELRRFHRAWIAMAVERTGARRAVADRSIRRADLAEGCTAGTRQIVPLHSGGRVAAVAEIAGTGSRHHVPAACCRLRGPRLSSGLGAFRVAVITGCRMAAARERARMTARTCDLFGVPVAALTMDEALTQVDAAIASRRRLQIGVVNAAKLVNMRRSPALRDDVLSSDMVLADGAAVVWASRVLGQALPERVAGIDLMAGILARGNSR